MDLESLDQVMIDLDAYNAADVLVTLNTLIIEEISDIFKFRSLLVVEKYLQTGSVGVETFQKIFYKMSENLKNSENPAVLSKRRKLELILESLKRLQVE